MLYGPWEAAEGITAATSEEERAPHTSEAAGACAKAIVAVLLHEVDHHARLLPRERMVVEPQDGEPYARARRSRMLLPDVGA